MNELYAIDPECPKSLDQLAFLSFVFGFTEGRFIAEFPRDWERVLISELKKNGFDFIDGPQRLKLINILEKLRNASLPPKEARYLITNKWIDNALDNINYHHFHAIICNNKDSSSKCITIEDALHNNKLEDSRACKIDSNHEKYINLMYPLLFKSTEIYFQDVNFRLFNGVDKRRNAIKIIHLLLQKIKDTQRCNRISFIFGEDNYPDPKLKQKAKEVIDNIAFDIGLDNFKTNFKFEKKLQYHPRYVFSVKAGIRYDYGFDTPNEAKNIISWISKKELDALLKQHNI